MAGSLENAYKLPADEALDLLDQVLKDKDDASYKQAVQVWASMFPAYSMGGKPPEPPEEPAWYPKKLTAEGIVDEWT